MSAGLGIAQPALLVGLLLLPLYALLRHRHLRREALAYPPLQYRRPGARARLLPRLQVPLECLLLATVILALAGPHRESELELIEDEGVDVLLVLDVSLSMLAEDFPPNRLEALRGLAGDFVRRSGGDRIGLVVFARDSYVQAPLTTDHRVLLELLEGATVGLINQVKSGGTAIGDALLVTARHLESARVEGRDQALVLITDGESNLGSDPELAARYVRAAGVRLYAIGIGGEEPVEVWYRGERLGGDDPYMAYLDDRQLQAIAVAADGRYYRATEVNALERIFAELSRLESAPLEIRTVASRRFFAAELSLAGALLFLGGMLLGGVLLRRPFR